MTSVETVSTTTHICDYCHESFVPTRDWQKFCPGSDHQKLFWRQAHRLAAQAVREARG